MASVRSALPRLGSWARLLIAPSSYLLVLALVATLAAKWIAIRRLEDTDLVVQRWLAACSIDVAVLGGLAAVLALVESRARWVAIPAILASVLVGGVALLNAGYLAISSEQITWSVILLGIERVGDVQSILGATIGVHVLHVIGAVLVVAAPPAATLVVLRRRGQPTAPRVTALDRARAAWIPAVVGALVHLVVPSPQDLGLGKLQHSAVLRTYRGMITGAGTDRDEVGRFAGYTPKALVTAETEAALRTGPHPNIVVVILESTRRDATSLPGASARASTPTLVALAGRGLEMTHARAVMPLTSKSIWSMLCGRLPLMQHQLYENSDALGVDCLPALLARTGWRTLFLQSADGQFEDRPRLAAALGFSELVARNDLGSELLGYVASDEAALPGRLGAWLDRERAAPFFVTILTSGTHHPYVLSDAQTRRAREAGLPVDHEIDRYARQMEIADRMIASVIEELSARGLLDTTIIAVLGDHGEGFGDKGTMQHGANFYEEGLRVPWVIAGPGVPQRRVAENTIVPDLAPTLLGLLGASLRPELDTPARSVLADVPSRVLPFACLYDAKCRGFVDGTSKVVYIHETGEAFSFDLARDPDERSPAPLSAAQQQVLEQVQELLARFRTKTWLRQRGAMDRYPAWSCPAGRPCLPR